MQSGDNHIAYCFAEKTGYSSNLDLILEMEIHDGTFVYTGFKPALLISKKNDSSSSEAWVMVLDNKRLRSPINPMDSKNRLVAKFKCC